VSVSIRALADCSGDCCTIVKAILPQKGTKSTNEVTGKSFVLFVPFLWQLKEATDYTDCSGTIGVLESV
jgi:hypothetical protein